MTQALALFRQAFAAEPAGVWAAPGRVNLIGEHTDYNDGLVLPFALAARTEAAISPRGDGTLRVCSTLASGDLIEVPVAALAPGQPPGWGRYVAGVSWALGIESGFDIAIASSVPVGAGLASSAALVCAVALGINELLDLGIDRRRLAARARVAENDYVGAPTGGMDQMASLLCTGGHALLYDVRVDATEQIPFDPAAAGLEVLVVDTGVRHRHADGEYARRREECEAAAARLGVAALRDIDEAELDAALARLAGDPLGRRVRHVVTENARVLATAGALRNRDWNRVGELLRSAHASIRDDFEASCPELDVAVDTLVDSGALGARMTGGGFGGAALGLIPGGQVEHATRRLREVFASHGFAVPGTYTVAPSPGAGRIS